jgi:chromate transporter
MVAYIREMAVLQKKWLDDGAFRDGVGLCQTYPGATAMQTAAYVGLRVRGLPGAAASFIGFGLPAFVFMMVLSSLYVRGHTLPVVVTIFAGLGAIVVAIVAHAAVSFGARTLANWRGFAIALAAGILFGFGVSPLVVILLAAGTGWALLKGPPPSPMLPTASLRLYAPRSFAGLAFGAAAASAFLFFLSPRLFSLATLMMKIDLLAFGGGFASVPIMFHEVVDVRSWLDAPTLLNGIALGQITPGPIVITATFLGYLLYGVVGGIVATISVFLPSFLIVSGITPYYDRRRASGNFQKAIGGILCSFVGLLLSVTVRFGMNVS